MVDKKVRFSRQLSKFMAKRELKEMVSGLGKMNEDWVYKKDGKNRCAVYIEEEEGFEMPHWFWWKWCGWQFGKT